eukprot:TRINITY_DN332_c0_g1_i13.p1 TRINITY_DN332_c0_g1~~TRINITY_DN332_c0_g1_i13.p1  ORF type:complete len:217 (+),score=16.37 TRINITY_DN332_c0_g1_i13:66-716(+)
MCIRDRYQLPHRLPIETKISIHMCDALFKKFIPKSTPKVIVLPATGTTFVTGLSNTYSDDYPEEIDGMISEEEFVDAIAQINDTLQTYWPCFFSRCLGYICCPLSLGLSLCIPNVCMRDAEMMARRTIKSLNKRVFNPRGLNVDLVKHCSTSWLEVTYLSSDKELKDKSDYSDSTHQLAERKYCFGCGLDGLQHTMRLERGAWTYVLSMLCGYIRD